MTVFLSILLSLSVLAFQHSGYRSAENISARQQQNIIVTKANSTFSVANSTTVNVGTVTIHSSGTNTYINVTGSGTFSADVSGTPDACIINGQYVTGTPSWIVIDAH